MECGSWLLLPLTFTRFRLPVFNYRFLTGNGKLETGNPKQQQAAALRGAFSFTDFSGKTRHLAEFRGKFVLLDCWATWCAPCVADLPHLKKILERFGGVGLEILGMNCDEDESKARQMIIEKNLNWNHATYVSIWKTLRSYRIESWPTYVLIDREGKLATADQKDLSIKNLSSTIEKIMLQKK